MTRTDWLVLILAGLVITGLSHCTKARADEPPHVPYVVSIVSSLNSCAEESLVYTDLIEKAKTFNGNHESWVAFRDKEAATYNDPRAKANYLLIASRAWIDQDYDAAESGFEMYQRCRNRVLREAAGEKP